MCEQNSRFQGKKTFNVTKLKIRDPAKSYARFRERVREKDGNPMQLAMLSCQVGDGSAGRTRNDDIRQGLMSIRVFQFDILHQAPSISSFPRKKDNITLTFAVRKGRWGNLRLETPLNTSQGFREAIFSSW